MADISYSAPLRIVVDDNTGLLLLVDSAGKTLARAELATDLNNLARTKGVADADLPAPVDPRKNPSESVNTVAAAQQAKTETAADVVAATETPATSDTPVQSDFTGTNAGPSVDEVINAGQNPVTAKATSKLSTKERSRLKKHKTGTGVEKFATQQFPISYKTEEASTNTAALGQDTATPPVSVSGQNDTNGGQITITPNKLHEYATYTYGITLHLLTKDAFNEMADDPAGLSWLPKSKTLISTAGRYGNNANGKNIFHRPTQFSDDFYFDGLNMTTIIGPNQQTRGSNFIELGFNIIEPYGLTFINRLLDLSTELGVQNYLINPYVLQVDFFGNTDAGEILNPLPNLTKFLPIKFTEIKIKVGNTGSNYAIKAIPYNHMAFLQSIAATPADFEVSSQKINDFFSNNADTESIKTQANQKAADQREIANINQVGIGELTPEEQAKLDSRKTKAESNVKAGYKVKSYTGAYNAYQQFLKDKGTVEVSNVMKFLIDAEIADSDIATPAKNPISANPMPGKSAAEINKNAQANNTKARATPASGPNESAQKFNINAGTSVNEVVNMIMRSSKYITDQIDNKNNVDTNGQPLNWFKLIPKIKIIDYDHKRNDFAYEATYVIKKYTYHNSKHPLAPQSNVDQIKQGLRKSYNYIYTGENNDIIDFAIDFDTLFFTAVNVFTENTTTLNNSQTNTPKPEDRVDKLQQINQPSVTPQVWVPVAGNKSTQIGFNVNTNATAQKASDVMQSIYSGSRGDMLNLKLKIIGDPDFIKQDDIFLNPANTTFPDEKENHDNSGSILTDRGDIFCLVSWRTPVDLDDNTGSVRELSTEQLKESKFLESHFNGVYKVLKVTSEFKSGKFEQTLELVRYNDVVVNQQLQKESQAQREANANTNAVNSLDLASKDEVPSEDITPTEAPSPEVIPEESSGSYSVTQYQSRTAAAEPPVEAPTPSNPKLQEISKSGKTVDVSDVDSSTNTTTNSTTDRTAIGNPPPSDPPPDPNQIDPNKLPAGVTVDENTGLYIYRGIRFSANDKATLNAIVESANTGVPTTVTVIDAESGATRQSTFDPKAFKNYQGPK